MASSVQTPPSSPNAGARKKGPKNLPKLPLSAFNPPNTGASDRFPLQPSPSTLHPSSVVDAYAAAGQQQGSKGSIRTSGAAVAVSNFETLKAILDTPTAAPIVAAILSLSLEDGPPSSTGIPSAKIPIAVSTTFNAPNPKQIEGIKWALARDLIVYVDVQCDLIHGSNGWDALEELIGNCTGTEADATGKLVLMNLLPPPRMLDIPLVKLLTHSAYQTYQHRIAGLSLARSTYLAYLPPDWNAAVPPTPPPPGAVLSPIESATSPTGEQPERDSKEKREWKRRVKMFIGPALEAFGTERLLFGSSPSSLAVASSGPDDWYELARESFAELGVEQNIIDSVFGGNARALFRVA